METIMSSWFTNPLNLSLLWVSAHFAVYLSVFVISLYINFNFNTIMVGLIYLIPLIPFGLTLENSPRFLMVSFQNMVFGIIELVIFAITVQKTDPSFDKLHIKQLVGHTFPIAAALVGLSFIGRTTETPFSAFEFTLVVGIFFLGSALRVLAVYQVGSVAFKFDIVFRDKQKLKSDQLYGLVRHPSYTAMMLVILAYAINTHNLPIALLGLLSAWFGFQYRIVYEEKALEELFGEDYRRYQALTGMWFPRWRGKVETGK